MIRDLVERAYAALASGDRDGLLAVLDPDFEGELAAGMPHGLGGRRVGAQAAVDDGWWAIGRLFAVRAHPQEWIPTADGRLLVAGTYHGRERATGHEVEAAFTHLWAADGERLVSVRQVTDTVRWTA